jgi:hypothetical protein
MRRAVLLLALAACGSKAPAPKAPPPEPEVPPAEQPRRFDWGAPCHVPVTEHAARGGHTFEVAYVVHAEPAANGAINVHRDSGRMISADGVAISSASPEEQRSVDAIVNLPAFEVGADGRFARSSGDLTAFADLNVQVFVDAKGEDARAAAVEFMQSRGFVELVDVLQRDLWGVWVEVWLDEGTPEPGAAHGKLRLRWQHDPAAPLLEAELEPSTLRPTWTRRTDAPGHTVEYRFDWAHATGCGNGD